MRSTGRRGVRQSFSTPRTSTYTLRFEGNASLFVRTGAVRYERDNQTVPADESHETSGQKCACNIVAKGTAANFWLALKDAARAFTFGRVSGRALTIAEFGPRMPPNLAVRRRPRTIDP